MILDQIEVLVLIETLWNVKYQFDHVVNRTSCINRNIVECKAGHGEQTKRNELSINRNIVECKVSRPSTGGFSLRINRNIVECKVGIALTCLECSG